MPNENIEIRSGCNIFQMLLILLGLIVTMIVSVLVWGYLNVDGSTYPQYIVLYLVPHLVWLYPIRRSYKNDRTIRSIHFFEDYFTINSLVEKEYSVHWMAVKKIKFNRGFKCYKEGLSVHLKSGRTFDIVCERRIFDAVILELKNFRIESAKKSRKKAAAVKDNVGKEPLNDAS